MQVETKQHEHLQQERDALSKSSKDLGLMEYWSEREVIENPAFRSTALPFVWRWQDMQPLLAKAADIVPMELAYRRALLFANPGLAPKAWMTTTIYGGCSWYNPGESAEVHRHPASASRFVLSGDGGWTTVEGEKCMMSRGDLILTPNGTWHNHGNDGAEPVIWVDILDLPLTENLNNSWVMDYDYSEDGAEGKVQRKVQSVSLPDDYSAQVYATGGVKPMFINHHRASGIGSPMYVYRWRDTLDTLERLRQFEPDAADGISIEYINPLTGDAVTPTLSYGVHLFPAGFVPEFQRKTSSTVYCVIEGEGRTELENGIILTWARNDVFVVPSATWYRHINTAANSDLLLYAVSDEPALRQLGFLKKERRVREHSSMSA